MDTANAWFDAASYAWIPGTALGCLAGLWGALGGVLAPAGKAKLLVVGLGGTLIAASLALLVTGVVALVAGQPYGVWYGFGLAGLIGTIVVPCLMPVILVRYRQAELRRIEAEDL